MWEIEKAIEDAQYLRDSASYSRFSQRGDYYNNWALYSLYNLYIVDNQFKNALNTIDTMLKKKKNNDPKVLFAGGGSFLSFHDKIELFEHFNKDDKIIPFLKETCLEHFNWYFENINNKDDYYVNSSKENGFYFLKIVINYMRKFEDDEYSKFNEIYYNFRYQVNENYETINPNLNDEELKVIIQELLE